MEISGRLPTTVPPSAAANGKEDTGGRGRLGWWSAFAGRPMPGLEAYILAFIF